MGVIGSSRVNRRVSRSCVPPLKIHFLFLVADLGDAFFLFAYDQSGKVSANEVGACIRYDVNQPLCVIDHLLIDFNWLQSICPNAILAGEV